MFWKGICLNFFDSIIAPANYNAVNLMHVNIRSLSKNFIKLESLLSNISAPLDAIAITETWLTESTNDSLFIPGYNFVSKVRRNKIGGGVGIFINSLFSYKVRDDLCRMLNYMECIFIEVNHKSFGNLLIGCMYRPPNADSDMLNSFNSELSSILKSLECERKKTAILAGDFNFDLLKADSHSPTNDFVNVLTSFSMLPTIKNPTRITDHSSSLIDNIFVNCLPSQLDSAIFYSEVSDHLPIAIHLESNTMG